METGKIWSSLRLTFDVVVVGEEEVRLEPPVLVEGDGGVVGGEDVEVDGAHVAVVVDTCKVNQK